MSRRLRSASRLCALPLKASNRNHGLPSYSFLPRFFSASPSQDGDKAKVTDFSSGFNGADDAFKVPEADVSAFTGSTWVDNFLSTNVPSTFPTFPSFPTDSLNPFAAPVQAVDGAELAVKVYGELGHTPTHLVMRLIDNIHLTADIPYWGAIVVTTICLRTCLFPLAVYTIANASRMPYAQPKIQALQKEFTEHPNMTTDTELQKEYQRKMMQLMKREGVRVSSL